MKNLFNIKNQLINKLILSVVSLCLTATLSQAQDYFQKAYGSTQADDGYAVTQTSDGGYMALGTTIGYGAGSTDMYAIRLDVNGDTLWTKTYGGTGNEDGLGVAEDQAGNLFMMGRTYSFGQGQSDFYVVKTDANGDTLWTRAYGGTGNDRLAFGTITNDGGCIMTGYTTGFSAGNRAVYVVRIDGSGAVMWGHLFGGGNQDEGYHVQQTEDGGFAVAGYTQSFGAGSQDAYLLRLDSAGNMLWSRVYGGTNVDIAYSVRETLDSGFVLGVETRNGVGFQDFLAIKTDANGDTLWTRTYGGDYEAHPHVIEMADSGFVFSGHSFGFGPGGNIGFIVRTNVNGDTLWTKRIGGSQYEIVSNGEATADGGAIFVGTSSSFSIPQFNAFFVFKMDSLGSFGGCNEYGAAPTLALGNAIVNVTTGGTLLNTGGSATGAATITTTPPTIEDIACIPSCNGQIYGVVSDGVNPLTMGDVYLLKDLGPFQPLDTIDITTLNALGEYTFLNVDTGSYYTQVDPDETLYPTALDSYHPQTHRWDSATVITMACNAMETAHIQVVDPGAAVGPGTFTGTIALTDGFRSNMGDPIPGLEVVVERTPSGSVAGSDITSAVGFYIINDLTADDYIIYVDYPGLGMIATYNLTVTATDTVFNNLDFWINEADGIYTLDPEVSVEELLGKVEYINVYPNPFADQTILKFDNPKRKAFDLAVFDLTGKTVQTKTNIKGNEIAIQRNDLKPGIYIFELKNSQRIFRGKFMVTDH
jgi:hypothetical protein